eukprot:298311_1
MNRIQHIANHLSHNKHNLNGILCNASNEKIVIIGSGLIGVNFSVLFARAGYNVTMYDIKESQLEQAMNDLKNDKLPLMQKYDMLFGKSADNVFRNISITTNLRDALTNAIFIQECIPENLIWKQDLFAKIGNTLTSINGGNNCIISSSTTSIRPSKLIKKMRMNSENLIVSHPVNPPMAIPLIEICPHPNTNKFVINKTREIMTRIGLKPCVMKKEAAGFVLNRLQYALLQAAYQIVDEGIADPEDVDMTVKHGLGLRWSFMGPFETIHLNAPNGVNDYCERYTKGMHHVLSLMFKPDKNGNESYEHWTPQIWNKIHNDIENNICKVNELKDRCEWRDSRLLNLAVHKREQDKKDQKM